MHQFLHGSDDAYAGLERRARVACVVFPSQAMPPGATPSRARIGFQIDEQTGEALLLVDRGVRCSAGDPLVRAWFDTGVRRFPSFAELRRWIQKDLRQAFDQGGASGLVEAERLTDLTAVQAALRGSEVVVAWNEAELFRQLAAVVRGQDAALRRLARRVCLHAARRQPRRPATFFAVGPTGVGKTKTAETLAAAMGGIPGSAGTYGYLRLDMSEYQERHRVSQLLGAPQGYIGYGDGAQLVDALATNPKTVVLFDEIEKAHSDVLRALMNAMDAGRLSSSASVGGQGRSIDCREAIFLFTSNLDAEGIVSALDEADAYADDGEVDRVCRRQLRRAGVAPELIGRIGCFLVFRPMDEATSAEVVALAVVAIGREYGLEVRFIDPLVIARILQTTRTEGLGARPFEYAVDDLLGDSFACAARAGRDGAVEVHANPEPRVVRLAEAGG